jgi:Carboxypeptidase regulatory-like domain/TonB-dependent Receptor Plug Domain
MRNGVSRPRLAVLLLTIAVCLLMSQFSSAQTVISGEITGTVTDPTHGVVPNAKVTLVSKDTGASSTVTTSSAGTFRFPLLRPGAYELTVSAANFRESKRTVNAGVGEVTEIPVELELGEVSQVVEVTATEPLLQTTNANIAATYTPDQIENVPNPGGDLTNYALSTPGVVLSTGAGYGNFTAFGMGGTSNLYTVNGGDMNDPYNNLNNSGSSNNMLGQNEIQEVAIVHNAYTGQYGRAASVNMNFTTKSGSNSFHGNAKWDWNGRYLNANDWFNNAGGTPTPFANSNEWGGSVGGPIVKNKLFFFYDNEGLRYVLPAGGTPVYIPTLQWAAAVQANINATQPAESSFYQTMFKLYAGAPGSNLATPLAVGDATTPQGGCGDFSGTTLGGTLFGTAGGQACTQTFRTNVNNKNVERLQTVRIDFALSDKDHLNGRYFQDRGTQPTFTDPINSAFNSQSIQPQDGGEFTETHSFNPNLLNQLIVGGFYYSAVFGPKDLAATTAVFPTTIGVAQGGNNCLLLDGSLSCIGGEVYRYPQGRNVTQYQLVDDVSWTRGNHGLKFGVNFRRVDWADYGIAPLHTGDLRMSSITDFVNGVLSSAGGSVLRRQYSVGSDEQINNYSVGFYGQDEWRVSSNLKITAALRIDRNSNETCTSKCFVLFNGDFNSISHDINTPYNQSVATGQSNIFHSLERVVWEPRAGFAWSPGGKNTVVRGGIGIFSDLYPAQLSTNQLTNPPNTAIWNITGGAAGSLPIAPGVAGGAFARADANNAALTSGFPAGGTIGSIQAAVPTFTGPNFYTANTHIVNPKYAEWNLELQHSFGSNMMASVDYVGNHGWHELIYVNGMNAFANVPFRDLPGAAPDPRLGTVIQLTNGAVSNYNGLILSFTRRVTRGFTATLSYTYSRAFDDISNGGVDQYSTNQSGDSLRFQVDPSNRRLNYGPSDYDFIHVLNLNYVWELPLFKKSRFLGGWMISGVLFSRSGQPYSVVNTSVPGKLLGNYTATGSLAIADFLGGSTAACNNPDHACLLASQFATTPAQTDFGNLSRNRFRGPSYFDTDLSVKKNFPIREALSFTIGANAYNILNHPNFGNPDSSITSSTFGTIQNTVTPASSPYGNFQGSAVSGRILQLELQVKF